MSRRGAACARRTCNAPPLTSTVWGDAFSLCEGYASDPIVRHRAATGGVLTVVTQHLVESGAVEMVCQCSPNFQGDPLLDGPQLSPDGATVLQHAGSRYGPSAPLAKVMQLLDAGTVFALVGKPCDIGAMRRLALIDPRVDAQVPYMLSIFCEGPTDLVTLRRSQEDGNQIAGRRGGRALPRQRLPGADDDAG